MKNILDGYELTVFATLFEAFKNHILTYKILYIYLFQTVIFHFSQIK